MGMLKIQWRRRYKMTLVILCSMLLAWGFGLLIFTALMAGEGERYAVPMGTVFAGGMGMLVHLFYNPCQLGGEFNLAVSMGATRKGFLRGYFAASVSDLLLIFAASALLLGVETGICRLAWGMPIVERLLADRWTWTGIALLVLGLFAAELFFSALLMKFGYKIFWLVWVLAMLSPHIMTRISEDGVFKAWGTRENSVLALVLFGMMLIGWRMLRRQRVTL